MSNSDRMSEVIQENKISSPKARKVETDLIQARNAMIERLTERYPTYSFSIESTLDKADINNKLKEHFDCGHDIGVNLSNERSQIRPDGGLIYLIGKKRKYLLAVIEGKHQGTNDRRASEGKLEQARGNAIERSYKNFKEIQNYCLDESIFSYLIFASGCDLERTDESIRDRLTAMVLGGKFNKLYMQNIKDRYGNMHQRASVFIGVHDVDALSSIMFDACSYAVDYYVSKYVDAEKFDTGVPGINSATKCRNHISAKFHLGSYVVLNADNSVDITATMNKFEEDLLHFVIEEEGN
jgi:hypothetical protein